MQTPQLSQPEAKDLVDDVCSKIRNLIDDFMSGTIRMGKISENIDTCIDLSARAYAVHPIQVIGFFEELSGMTFRLWCEDQISKAFFKGNYHLLSDYLHQYEDFIDSGWTSGQVICLTEEDIDDVNYVNDIDENEDTVPINRDGSEIDDAYDRAEEAYSYAFGGYYVDSTSKAWKELVALVESAKEKS